MATPTRERIAAKDETILLFIVRYKGEHGGNSPSFRDIMRNAHLTSTSLVPAALDRLERAGRIWRNKGVNRSIEILERK